jgi:hypothetical protein
VISRGKALLAALAAIALVGCATPEKVAFNQETAGAIDSVTIVVPPEPKKYTVLNTAHAGMLFGAIGGAIAAMDQLNKEEKFYKVAQSAKLSVSAALAKATKERLTAAGYTVKVQEGVWEEKDGKWVLQTEKLPAELGAVLVIAPTVVGYVATFAEGTHYLPTIHAGAKLLDKDRKTTLYQGFHSTGWQPASDAWRHTKAQKTFPNFDALMAQPKVSTAALELSAEAIAVSIAEDLRRR